MRRLWSGEPVDHEGSHFSYKQVVVHPTPYQPKLEPWLGGSAPAALRRCGRLSDGWLPSLCTADEAAVGKQVIDAAAADAGREISPEHFGMSIGYLRGDESQLPERTRRALERRKPGVALADVMPFGLKRLREVLEQFIAVGFSKFVLRPVNPPANWHDELGALSDAVLDLQSA
jgi:alkanesulfonate monooxygenase SsuD/methylene tetrahydromethanopterin reductase-like flavin-dependent oxidoreductase (luciferase family)